MSKPEDQKRTSLTLEEINKIRVERALTKDELYRAQNVEGFEPTFKEKIALRDAAANITTYAKQTKRKVVSDAPVFGEKAEFTKFAQQGQRKEEEAQTDFRDVLGRKRSNSVTSVGSNVTDFEGSSDVEDNQNQQVDLEAKAVEEQRQKDLAEKERLAAIEKQKELKMAEDAKKEELRLEQIRQEKIQQEKEAQKLRDEQKQREERIQQEKILAAQKEKELELKRENEARIKMEAEEKAQRQIIKQEQERLALIEKEKELKRAEDAKIEEQRQEQIKREKLLAERKNVEGQKSKVTGAINAIGKANEEKLEKESLRIQQEKILAAQKEKELELKRENDARVKMEVEERMQRQVIKQEQIRQEELQKEEEARLVEQRKQDDLRSKAAREKEEKDQEIKRKADLKLRQEQDKARQKVLAQEKEEQLRQEKILAVKKAEEQEREKIIAQQKQAEELMAKRIEDLRQQREEEKNDKRQVKPKHQGGAVSMDDLLHSKSVPNLSSSRSFLMGQTGRNRPSSAPSTRPRNNTTMQLSTGISAKDIVGIERKREVYATNQAAENIIHARPSSSMSSIGRTTHLVSKNPVPVTEHLVDDYIIKQGFFSRTNRRGMNRDPKDPFSRTYDVSGLEGEEAQESLRKLCKESGGKMKFSDVGRGVLKLEFKKGFTAEKLQGVLEKMGALDKEPSSVSR